MIIQNDRNQDSKKISSGREMGQSNKVKCKHVQFHISVKKNYPRSREDLVLHNIASAEERKPPTLIHRKLKEMSRAV